MPQAEKYRVNYFVGGMLAQGGDVWLEDSKIVFSPTSALDRAMGAKNVEIPFQGIRGLEHKGDIFRTINIKTDKKIHKFEGSQANQISDKLETTLKAKGFLATIQVERKNLPRTPPTTTSSLSTAICTSCSRTLKPDFAFCPYCGKAAKPTCRSCHHVIERDWASCAFCGQKLRA